MFFFLFIIYYTILSRFVKGRFFLDVAKRQNEGAETTYNFIFLLLLHKMFLNISFKSPKNIFQAGLIARIPSLLLYKSIKNENFLIIRKTYEEIFNIGNVEKMSKSCWFSVKSKGERFYPTQNNIQKNIKKKRLFCFFLTKRCL